MIDLWYWYWLTTVLVKSLCVIVSVVLVGLAILGDPDDFIPKMLCAVWLLMLVQLR